MKTVKEISVDGETYMLADWPVDMATEIWAWLVSTLGPSVKPAFEVLVENGQLDVQVKEISAAIGIHLLDVVVKDLSRLVPPAEYSKRMAQIFSEGILYKGQTIKPNIHFARRLKHMHLVALEVLKYQFADFLEGVPLTFGSSMRTGSPLSTQVQ